MSVTFDVPAPAATAGGVAPTILAVRLDLAPLVDSTARPRDRTASTSHGRTVAMPVATIPVIAIRIDHRSRTRASTAAQFLPFRVTTPSTHAPPPRPRSPRHGCLRRHPAQERIVNRISTTCERSLRLEPRHRGSGDRRTAVRLSLARPLPLLYSPEVSSDTWRRGEQSRAGNRRKAS